MSERLAEYRIVMQLSEALCQRVARKVIRVLQKRRDALLSGDDSGLISTWDEICVQVQHESSFYWDEYEDWVERLVATEIERLKPYERGAIWLQTPEGTAWDAENEDDRDPYPVVPDEIVVYITDRYVLSAAADWSNQRIERYLEQYYSME